MIDNKIKGNIIFISSIHQWYSRGIIDYSATKAAIGMIIKEMAMELAKHEIRVNGIAPGCTKYGEGNELVKHDKTPLYNKSIDPKYIGRAIIYLASDYFSKQTTSTIIKIDGGLSLYNWTTEA